MSRRLTNMFGRSMWLVCALGVHVALVPAAAADELDVSLELVDFERWPVADDGMRTPRYTAVVRGAPAGLGMDDFAVAFDRESPDWVGPSAIRTYRQSDEPLALVILVQGQERWMGNETYREHDDLDRMEGSFTHVAAALDAFAGAWPQGSVASVIAYDMEVWTVHAAAPIAELSGASLGDQTVFRDRIGRSLIAGLDEVSSILSAHTGMRRVVVVIGDGEGHREDIQGDLRRATDSLKSIEAEVFSIHHLAVPTDSPIGQHNMRKLGYSGAVSVASAPRMVDEMARIVEQLDGRYYVDFDGPRLSIDPDREREPLVRVGSSITELYLPSPIGCGYSPDRDSESDSIVTPLLVGAGLLAFLVWIAVRRVRRSRRDVVPSS